MLLIFAVKFLNPDARLGSRQLFAPKLSTRRNRWQTLRALLAVTALTFGLGDTQAQTNQVSTSKSVTNLRFQDFFKAPIGPRGVEFGDTLRHADGLQVRLAGYMVQQESPEPGRFLLAPRPVQMSEHADGEADDLPVSTVWVHLDPAQKDWTVAYVRGQVVLNGVLSVSRNEEAGGRISWIRLQLGPEATRSTPANAQSSLPLRPQHAH